MLCSEQFPRCVLAYECESETYECFNIFQYFSRYPASGIVEPGDVLLSIAGEDLAEHFADGDLTTQHDDLVAMLATGTSLSLGMIVL